MRAAMYAFSRLRFFRLVLLSTASLTLLSAAPHPARAQVADNRAVADRIDRLERDIMLMQRQMARGEAPPAGSGGGDSGNGGGGYGSLQVKLDQIEEEISMLRGKYEESDHKASQLSDKLDKIQSDVEFRLNALEGHANAPASKPTA
jgi:hypothetical protein